MFVTVCGLLLSNIVCSRWFYSYWSWRDQLNPSTQTYMKLGAAVLCLSSLFQSACNAFWSQTHFAENLCCLFSEKTGPNFLDEIRDLDFSKFCTQSISSCNTASLQTHINPPQTEGYGVVSQLCNVSSLFEQRIWGQKTFYACFQEFLLVASTLCAAAAMLLLCSFQRSKFISMKMSWTGWSPVDMFFSWNEYLANGRKLWMVSGRWKAMHLGWYLSHSGELGQHYFVLTTRQLSEKVEGKDKLWIRCTSGVGLNLFHC